MDIISAVANLQKECDYYRDAVKECQGVIKQLLEGPGEVEYIHPMDMGEMLNSSPEKFVDIYYTDAPVRSVFKDDVKRHSSDRIIEFAKTGKKYKQSIWIPARLQRTIK